MKIAFLHMTMGLVDRGSEVVVDQLATALSKENEVLVIQSGKVSKKLYKVERVMPIEKAPVASPKNILDKLLFRLHLDDESGMVVDFTRVALPLLSQFDPDIIVAVNGSLQIRLLQGQSREAKIVAFGHAGIGYHDRDTLRARPALFIALSNTAEVWARQIAGHHTKVVYIPNPVEISKVEKINLKLPKPVVITVGALSKYKNIDKVIGAIGLTQASLLLIGDGEEHDSVGKSLSMLANDFRWIHHLDPQELASYYASAVIFCFVPDPQESFGRVYLEAMAAGLPIVASDDPVRRSIVGERGIYVDPRNTGDIARGINQAIGMGRIDYSVELKKYKLKTVVTQIEKEFHDLIS